MQVVRPEHAPPRTPKQRVIDGQADRRARRDEHRDEEVQQHKAELVGLPAPTREEIMRAAVMPDAGQSGGLKHPRDRAVTDPPDRPDQQHAEGLKRWLREARPQQGQQPRKRTGNLTHGGDPPDGKATGTLATPRSRWT